MSFWTISTRGFAEAFASVWAAITIIGLSVGGTMVMRKFHNSFSVGFFLGSVVATAQFFLLLSLIYFGYAADRQALNKSGTEDIIQGLTCLAQSALLCIFAAILGTHRSAFGSESSVLRDAEFPTKSEYDPPLAMK